MRRALGTVEEGVGTLDPTSAEGGRGASFLQGHPGSGGCLLTCPFLRRSKYSLGGQRRGVTSRPPHRPWSAVP